MGAHDEVGHALALTGPNGYRQVLEYVDHPVVWSRLDADGCVRVADVNLAAIAWLARPRVELVGAALMEIAPEGLGPAWAQEVGFALQAASARRWRVGEYPPAGGQPMNVELLPLDGTAEIVSLLRFSGGAERAHSVLDRKLAQLEAILDQQSECIKLVDADGTLLDMNGAGLDMLGVPDVSSANQIGLLEFVHPADRAKFRVFHQQVCAGQRCGSDFRLLTGDGTLRYVESIGVPLRDPVSGLMQLLALTRDVTARVVAQDDRARIESRLAFVLEAAHIGEWQLDLRTWVVTHSSEYDRCFGYDQPCAEWSREVFLQHVHPDDRERVRANGERALIEGQLDHEFRVVWPDGSDHWLWIRAVVIADEATLRGQMIGICVDISARKTAQAEARLADERWRFAIEGSGDGVWDWDIASGQVVYSKRWAEILGYSQDALSSEAGEWKARVHPDDRAVVLAALQAHLSGATPRYDAEHRLRTADGSWKWICGRGLVISRDAAGNPLRMIGTNTDIDALKRGAERIGQLTERLALAVKGSGFGVWELDLDRGRLLWDEKMHEIYGHTTQSFDQDPESWRRCLHPDDLALVDARFVELMAVGTVDLFQYRIRRASDSAQRCIEANGYLQRAASGQPLRLVGMNRDVTERWEAQQTLRLLGTSLFHLHDMVLIKQMPTESEAGRLIYANGAFTDKTGYTGADLPELLPIFFRHSHDDEPVIDIDANQLHGQSSFRREVSVRAKDGHMFWIDLDAVPVHDEHGTTRHWVLIGTDISERKKAEQAIHEANASLEWRVAQRTEQLNLSNQGLQTFTHSISHDLRAHLRGIEGWSRALHEDCASLLDDNGRAHLGLIRASVSGLHNLVDGLLRLARVGQTDLHVTYVDVSEMAQEIAERLATAQPARSVVITIEPGIALHADRALLQLTLENLLDNAWKYTVRRGDAQVQIDSRLLNGERWIAIRDNGVGFNMTYVGDLCRPFKRLHRAEDYSGNGIGLSIVDRILRRHGARLDIQSEPRKGSVFTLIFPEAA